MQVSAFLGFFCEYLGCQAAGLTIAGLEESELQS
jgi:hypothetical protein